MMIQLIYASRATHAMTEKELEKVLAVARSRNSKQGITGLLLYAEEKFLQVLEGEEREVNDVYASIIKDPRNSGNVIYERKTISKREFPDWSMGFRQVRAEDKDKLKGFSDFLDKDLDLARVKLSHALLLLNQFRDLTR